MTEGNRIIKLKNKIIARCVNRVNLQTVHLGVRRVNGTFIGKTDDIIVPTVIKRRSSNIEVVTKKDLRESVLIKVLKEELLAIDNVNVIDLGAKKVDITYES